jgi:hypothetical protein
MFYFIDINLTFILANGNILPRPCNMQKSFRKFDGIGGLPYA